MSAPAGLLVRGHSSKPSPRTFDGSRMVLAAALALLGYLGIKWSVTPVCPSSTAPQVGIQGTDFCALPQASPHDLKEGGTPEVDMRALRRFIKKDGQELLTFTDFLLACASVEGCMLPIETPPLSDSEVVYVALTSTVTQYERLPAIISSWAKDLNYFAFR